MARAGRRVARRVDRPHRQRARPDDSVTPLALNVLPTGVASTQVVPSALTWSVSPASQRAGERAAHRLRRNVRDVVPARAAAVARQRRHRSHRRRCHRVQRIAWPVPAVVLPAVSIVRTDSVPAPDDSVTPLALNVLPTGVASTQVVPLALTWSRLAGPQGAGERAAHRLRRNVGDVVARRPAVARQRRDRAHSRRCDSVQRVAWPVPAVVLPAVSIVRTDSVPAPDDSVTPLALNVLPTGVASTQVVPSALTCSFSPSPSVPVNVPLTVCDATFVM